MQVLGTYSAVPVACFAGLQAFRNNNSALPGLLREFYTARADRIDDSLNASTGITPSQLQRLNELGTLPSVARHWDGDAALAELRSAASDEGLATRRPTAVQQMLAKVCWDVTGPTSGTFSGCWGSLHRPAAAKPEGSLYSATPHPTPPTQTHALIAWRNLTSCKTLPHKYLLSNR